MSSVHIGNSIKFALIKKGMNQQQLADRMFCTHTWVSRLANRKRASIPTIEQLADAFEMTVSQFIAYGEE